MTEKGFLKNLKPKPTIALRDALWAYQKAHQLPVGRLTIETLGLLGIK